MAPAWAEPRADVSTRRDAADFDAEVRRQRRAGGLAALDAGTESLGDYVTGTWAATHVVTLAPKTRLHYASLYDHHLRPFFGAVSLREIDAETIGRWQNDRLAVGAGPVAVRQALDLLGSVLEHAFVAGRISENPARRVRKARLPHREEVQALPPARVEAMRATLGARNASCSQCSRMPVCGLARLSVFAGLTFGSERSWSSGLFRSARKRTRRLVSTGLFDCLRRLPRTC
jgi:hypothetical protein